MTRFLETGITDQRFNAASFYSFDERQTTSVAKAVALQSNEQIVVGGLINQDAPISGGIARLDISGTLDTTFGTVDSFGVCCTVTTDNSVSALLIQNDGKIVAIEQSGNTAIVVARYLAK